MKTLVAILVTSTALAAGCTRVIEKQSSPPTVVSTPAIVERSSVAGATTPPAPTVAPGACLWEGQQTSSGGQSCRDHSQWRCNNGNWEQTATKC